MYMNISLIKKLLIPAFLLALVSCEKDYKSIAELDKKNIQEYMQKNNLNMIADTSGIYYEIISPGTGAPIDYKDKIPMHFSQKSLDGAYINADTIINRYADFFGYLSPIGIREGVKKYLKNRGGKIRLIVPSRQAFGRNGTTKIPANASLDYVVTVLDDKKLSAYEDNSIKKYLQQSNLSGFTMTSSGLYYKIIAAGVGSPITQDSLISVNYTGKLLNGTVFESGESKPTSVLRFIKGWVEAVPMINEGGQIRIVVPSNLAYGNEGSKNGKGGYTIPPFSILDFDIKVLKVEEPSN